MGITLKGYKKGGSYSNDVTYSGFFRLRRDIAYMLSHDIGVWYDCMIECLHGDKKEQKKWEDGINKAINEYLDVHKKSMEKVVDFLFMSDSEGRISYGTCKLICGLIDEKKRRRQGKIQQQILRIRRMGSRNVLRQGYL